MNLARLSARDRRALLLLTVVIIGALTLTRGIPELRAWTSERRASALELSRALVALRTGMASQRERKAALTERSAALAALEQSLLAGETPASAAASLAHLVGAAAESSSVYISSTQVRTDSVDASDTYARVAVRIDAVGDVRGLTNFLARLERGPARLVVRSLAVTQPEPLAEMESLRAEIEVAGLAHARAACECSGPACDCAQIVEERP